MHKKFIFDKLSEIQESCDLEYLNKYIDFCVSNHDPDLIKGANHHILSRTIFPEYDNFKENPWNLSRLTHHNHYVAHALLFKSINHTTIGYSWYAMNNTDFILEKDKPIELIGPELYEELILKRNKLHSENTSGKVLAKDLTTGKNRRVTKEEFDSDPNLVGQTNGSKFKREIIYVNVLDDFGNTKRIRKDSDEYESGNFVGHTKGKSTYKDESGGIIYCSTDDERVKSGKLRGINSGKTWSDEEKQLRKEYRKKYPEKGNAHRIIIFDAMNNPIYYCFGTFKQTCNDLNLPASKLAETYLNNSKISVTARSSQWALYDGWYARKMERIKI